MSNIYSPYSYVDLSEKKWDIRSDDLLDQEKRNGNSDPEQAASSQLFNEILKALFSFPDELLNPVISDHPKEICVIGGGVAGLTAAYELAVRGHHVTLLEASWRIGGRIRTHEFADGTRAELGAMRIPETHDCVNHYVNKLGLKRRPFVGRNDASSLYLRGQKFRLEDVHCDPPTLDTLRGLYLLDPSADNTLYSTNPFDAERLLNERLGVVIDREALELVFQHFAIPPRLEVYEQATMGQLMLGTPVSQRSVRLSHEAFELFGRATGILWFENVSYLQWIINELALYEPKKYELEGGMESLIAALAQAFKDAAVSTRATATLKTSCPVKEVRLSGGRAVVIWESSGVHESDTFDYVICTAPAPAAARIKFDPPLPPQQYEALTNLTYASAGKTIVRCTERFWESKEGIFGGGSFSDLPHQQCWYPADNSKESTNSQYQFGIVREGPQATHWEAISTAKSKEPGVFTAAYLWGANAKRFAALEDQEKTELILSSVEHIHGDLRTYIRDPQTDVIHCSWDNESSPGSGAFAFYAPGEQRRYQAALCHPHLKDNAGQYRLFFAGEHLAIAHAWIQSAVQTALSAVIHVINST
jgi:monoamine oxidase